MAKQSHRLEVRQAASGISKRTALRTDTSWLAMVAALACPLAAYGQTEAPSAAATAPPSVKSSRSAGLEQILVTARRRSEVLSKVPVAITAFNAKSLAQRTITKETDLQASVPGLTVKTTASQNQLNYSIRGQTLDAFSGSSPGVLPYLNDVALSSQTATAFYDLAGIEVLKGPQGTLFGRNATGGAVLYTSAQPTDTYGGYATVRVGDYGLNEYQGAINVPIVPGKVDLRIAGDITEQSGYVKDLNGGATLGDTDAKAFRVSLKVTPTDELTNTLIFQYGSYGGTELMPALYSYYAVGQTNNGLPLNTTAASIYGNATLAQELALQRAHGPSSETLPYTPYHRSHDFYLADTTTYEVTPNITIKNIASVQSQVTLSDNPLSGAANGVLDLAHSLQHTDGAHYNIDQWSEELQLQGKALDSHLKYILGFYAASEEDLTNIPVAIGITLPTPIQQFYYNFTNVDQTQAVFAQGTYDLADLTSIHGLSVTLGGRETWEELQLRQGPQSVFLGSPKQSGNERAPSWQVGLDYQVTPQQLIYFVTRGSWRAGSFNGTTSPAGNENAFFPEYTHDFEIGTKFSGRVADRPASLNVAAYEQIVTQVQHDIYLELNGRPASFTHNVPKARVEGIELDGEVQLTNWLTLGGAGAYTYATYPDGNVNLFGQTLVFAAYQDTPRWTGSLFGQVALPSPERWGPMSFRADMYYQTGTVFSSLYEGIAPGTALPGYALVNLRYDWHRIMGTKFSFAAYIKNLLDRRYYLGGFALGPDVGFNTVEAGPPRMFGVELNYTF